MALTNDDFKKIERVADKVATKHSEELAVIVAKGFTGMKEYTDEKFKKVDGRFDDIEKHLDRIETHQQVDQGRFDNHDRRISALEKAV